MENYHIIGRAGAGSLIAEFLFREAGIDYDISFPDPAEVKSPGFFAANPLGRIPVLICPDGTQVFETLAIIHHIPSRFGDLAPREGFCLWSGQGFPHNDGADSPCRSAVHCRAAATGTGVRFRWRRHGRRCG